MKLKENINRKETLKEKTQSWISKISKWINKKSINTQVWWQYNTEKHGFVYLMIVFILTNCFTFILFSSIQNRQIDEIEEQSNNIAELEAQINVYENMWNDDIFIHKDLAFTTNYNDINTRTTVDIHLSTEIYEEYKSKDHFITENYEISEYESFCDGTYLIDIANLIKNSCGIQATDEEILQALLSFVQDKTGYSSLTSFTIKYESETGENEYPKYPLEILGDGTGDCEDFSILFCSLAEILGFETILVALAWEGETFGHMMSGVRLPTPPQHTTENTNYIELNGKDYYTCECTGYGEDCMIGDFPWDEPDYLDAIEVNLND